MLGTMKLKKLNYEKILKEDRHNYKQSLKYHIINRGC